MDIGMGLSIIHQDAEFLVVDKPPGLLSVPGRGPEKADCVVARASREFGWIREVHRLDQATSGLMLLARNPDAHRSLSAAFAQRQVEKTYLAQCSGPPRDTGLPGLNWEVGFITLFQRLDVENRPRQMLDAEKGKKAHTSWRVVTAPGSSPVLLELQPKTGRTHQLRLAMAACGEPILGDTLYGLEETAKSVGRLMLHAHQLGFLHPRTGEAMTIQSQRDFLSELVQAG